MEVDVEHVSDDPGSPLSSDYEPEAEELAELNAGSSKPLKRGRSRKDGTGFGNPTPTEEDLVRVAFEGDVLPL